MIDPQIPQPILDRRDVVRSAFAASTLAFLSACSSKSSDGSKTTDKTEVDKDTVRVSLGELASIDPYAASTPNELKVTYQLFDPLTSYDFVQRRLRPLAAASYAGNEDATEFTFKIKSATFHNGEGVSSVAFKRAWERVANPADATAQKRGASPFAYLLSMVDGYDALVAGASSELTGVTCPDDETLVVRLSSSYADFPYVVAHPALAPVPVQAVTDPDAFFVRPQGNGPFALKKEWKNASSISLVRNKAYYGSAPSVETIKFIYEDATDTAYKEFQSEHLDVSDVPVESIASKASGTTAEERCELTSERHYVQLPELCMAYLAIKTSSSKLSDVNVRRALSLSVDTANICKTVYRDATLSATGVVPPLCPGYRENAWEWCSYDQGRAAELLEELYPLEGKSRNLTLSIAYDKSGAASDVVDMLIDDLARVGITLEGEACDFTELQERMGTGDFELALTTWTSDIACMDAFLFPLFNSANVDGGNNLSGYANADADAKMAEARAALDDEERIALLQEAEDMVASDMPVIPLMFYTRGVCTSDRVEDLRVDPVGRVRFADAALTEA